MQFFDSDEPLEAEDYEFIEGMLGKHGSDHSIISASELDGFLTAIVSGPRMIMPSEWMSHIWGGEEHTPVWDSMEEVQKFHSLTMRMMNYNAEALTEFPEDFEPLGLIAENDGEDADDFILWCFGYLRAVNIYHEDWLELERENVQLLMPFAAITAELSDDYPNEITAEDKKTANSLVRGCAVDIHKFWLDRRIPPKTMPFPFGNLPAQSEKIPIRREGRKIGPNEPCPCGSGQKYKKCCLN